MLTNHLAPFIRPDDAVLSVISKEAFNLVASKFGIQALNSHQQLAVSKLIERKKDIFVNLPTTFAA